MPDRAARRTLSQRLVDLHTHTLVSDGTLSPTQLVERAAEVGLTAIAITDHDHVGGLAEARIAGARLGVEIVSGIELSATHAVGEVHVLGYLLDDTSAPLLADLSRFREVRAARGIRIVEKLQALGVDVTPEDVAQHAGAGAIGRPHVARALMTKGVVTSVQEAFERWLGDGKPAYVPKEKISVGQAIALIHAAGGVAALAHPGLLREEGRGALIREMAALGMDGIEVEYSRHAREDRRRFAAIAEELGLVQTGGSDFHGENKPDVALGSGVHGNVRVEYAVLDALCARAAKRRR